jgi:hypothetical protein
MLRARLLLLLIVRLGRQDQDRGFHLPGLRQLTVDARSTERRTSTPGPPPGLFGSSGEMSCYSVTLRSKRAVYKLPQSGSLNHILPPKGEMPFGHKT